MPERGKDVESQETFLELAGSRPELGALGEPCIRVLRDRKLSSGRIDPAPPCLIGQGEDDGAVGIGLAREGAQRCELAGERVTHPRLPLTRRSFSNASRGSPTCHVFLRSLSRTAGP